MKLNDIIQQAYAAETKVQNGELNGHAVPPSDSESGTYIIYVNILSCFYYLKINKELQKKHYLPSIYKVWISSASQCTIKNKTQSSV